MSAITFGHHKLHNRYCFKGVLHLVSPLRISSGLASHETDAPLMQTIDGVPYIPGSSMRGAIRSEIERILAAVDSTVTGLTSCTLFTKDDSESACISSSKQKQEALVTLSKSENGEAKALKKTEEGLCDVCKLFGSTVFASRLIIEDSLPLDNKNPADKRVIRDSVGIDRDTGTAADGAKFDFEVLETGPEFCFRMQVENVTDKDKKLLQLVLSLLQQQGLHVGGKRAAGLGRIKLQEDSLSVTGFANPQGLWDAMMNGKDLHQPLAWTEEQPC